MSPRIIHREGLLRRGLSFLINLCVGRLVLTILLVSDEVDFFYRDLEMELYAILPPFGAWNAILAQAFLLLVCSQLISFLTVLVTGRSLGFWLWEGEFRDQRDWQRLRRSARELWGVFCIPLFPFQLAPLFAKPLIQDLLAQTQTVFTKDHFPPKKRITGFAFLVLFGITSLTLSSEFLRSFVREETPLLKMTSLEPQRLKGDEKQDQNSLQSFQSRVFEFSTKTAINGEESLTFAPSFEFRQKPEKVFARPQLLIFDSGESTTQGRFFKVGNVDWMGIFDFYQKWNPLFSTHYPHLSELFHKQGERPSLLPDKAQKELETLMDRSIELRGSQDWKRAIQGDLWTSSYYKFREHLVDFILPAIPAETSMLILGSERFLHFRQVLMDPSGHQIVETFFSLRRLESPVYRMVWSLPPEQEVDQGLGLAKSFYSRFFTRSHWEKSQEPSLSSYAGDGAITATGVLDIFSRQVLRLDSKREDKSETLEEKIEKKIFRFYSDLALKGVEKHDPEITEKLSREMKQTVRYFRLRKKNHNFSVSRHFLWHLNKLGVFTKNRNSSDILSLQKSYLKRDQSGL